MRKRPPRVQALLKTRSATASCASGHPHASGSACADGHPSVGKRPPLRAPPATLFFLQTGRFADQRVGSGACCGTRPSKGRSCARARSAPRAQARAVPAGRADADAGAGRAGARAGAADARARASGSRPGELAPGRLYDVRAFKCCYAELGYLRRLAAAGRAGGTVVTSMRQLVAGLAALHPAWRIDGGEGFEDRDRHHRAVRRRLDALQAMGLLRWRIGTDLDGEERRTELELRPAPEVSAEELQAAARRLERWQARYGPALNTGSRTGIRNAAGHGRPLSASERQRRGCQRARAAAASRRVRGGSQSNSAPPFGAPATPENNARQRRTLQIYERLVQRTGVTRASAPAASTLSAALDGVETAGGGEGEARLAEGGAACCGGRCGLVVRRWGACVGSGGDGRAGAGAGGCSAGRCWRRSPGRRPSGRWRSPAGGWSGRGRCRGCGRRGWSRGGVRWRRRMAGRRGAGPLYGDDYARLRRAVARYERNRSGGAGRATRRRARLRCCTSGRWPAPASWPAGRGRCATRSARSISSRGGCGRSRPPTAPSTPAAPPARARRRRDPPPRALALTFRPTWPPWVLLDEHGQPMFDRLGMLRLDPRRAGTCRRSAATRTGWSSVTPTCSRAGCCPSTSTAASRWRCATSDRSRPPPGGRSSATISASWRSSRTAPASPISLLLRLSPAYRQSWLAQLRRSEADRARREMIAFKAEIANIAAERR